MVEILKDFEKEIAQKVIRYAADDKYNTNIPQPIFIVGSPGAGKTSIIQLLADELIENPTDILNGKRFFSSNDIINAIEPSGYPADSSFRERNDDRRRIIMIDDIDYFFKRSSFDDQYVLRNYLNRENAPLLLATVSRIDESLANYQAPFFEGVRVIYVPPFDISMLLKAGLPEDKKNRIIGLMKHLPPVVGSYKIACEIVSINDYEERDLKELVNRMGSLYRFKMEGMPVYSQKILYYLSISKGPLMLSELRAITGLSAGTLSTYLRQMMKANIIRKTTHVKRGARYEITDSLFKLWLSS